MAALVSLDVHTLGRALSDRLVLITGCQRSGTTLMLLMLGAHPAVVGYDERHVGHRYPSALRMLRHRLRGHTTCYKLPTKTFEPARIERTFPHARMVWMVRHPHAVVSSMRNLKMDWMNGKNWLDTAGRDELLAHRAIFPQLHEVDVAALDEVTVGALVWKYKLRARARFLERGLSLASIKFEDLVTHPESTMRRVLAVADLPWSAATLAHHTRHQGVFAGDTRGDRPIDRARARPQVALSPDDVRRIDEVCGDEMRELGYAAGPGSSRTSG